MRSFTLLELIIVVIIIGILATFAMPAFRVTQERALDNEARANLKLIFAAEKIYRMETNAYVACVDITAVNNTLKLSIPTSSPNWNYKVDATITTFTGKAQRTSTSDSRVWCIDQLTEEPYQTGCSW